MKRPDLSLVLFGAVGLVLATLVILPLAWLAWYAVTDNAGGLIVFGRVRDGVFDEPARLHVPQALRDIAYFVSQREFRLDISSTALRREQMACEGS